MITTHISAALAGLTTGFFAITTIVSPPPFLKVVDIVQDGQNTKATRILNYGGVADWNVVLVPADQYNPICWTIAGIKPNEGWSIYVKSEISESEMNYDDWVGQKGCYQRLESGVTYREYITWTPREDLPPVKHVREFQINQQESDQ